MGRVATAPGRDERGEVFPVAILYVGVLFTILIGLHVVLFSVGRTAVQAAADRGVNAVQAAPTGDLMCGRFTVGVHSVEPVTARECEGVFATLMALDASGSMVGRARPPEIVVDETAGIVAVTAFGMVSSPVLGRTEVAGYACGPLELIADGTPSRSDLTEC